MNMKDFAREHIAKNKNEQEFFYHVVGCIEDQLREWDKEYRVYIVKLTDYNLVVKDGPKTYNVELSEEEIKSLQSRSSYALDREIWRQLKRQGVPVKLDNGDYLKKIL